MGENNNYLASNIKFLRTRKNITQKQLGDFCGKSDVAIFYWESGSREPNAMDLVKICNFFGTTVDDLLNRDLRLEKNEFDGLEELFLQYKHLLTDDDRDTIRFIIEKRVKENGQDI
nr:helix-turn-helix transcriptional regulator [bacterium]